MERISENERAKASVEEFIDFDKATLLKVIENCEYEAVLKSRKGNIGITEKEIRKGARMLKRGIHLMDTKTLWAIIFQLRSELDNLVYLAMLDRNAKSETRQEFNQKHAAAMYDMAFARMKKL